MELEAKMEKLIDKEIKKKDSKDYQVCPTKDGYTCCGPSLL